MKMRERKEESRISYKKREKKKRREARSRVGGEE